MTDKDQINKHLEHRQGNQQKVNELIEKIDGLLYLPEGKALLEKIKEARKSYTVVADKVLKLLIDEGKRDEASGLFLNEVLPASKAYIGAVDNLIKLQEKLVNASGEEAKNDYASGRALLLILGAVALVIGVGFAFWVTRSITQPMAVAVRVAEGIAEGELDHHITVTSRDETGRLMQAMQRMSEQLRQIVGDIRVATSSVSTAANEIVQGNSDLSQRTQEQASALEETASSMEQMTSTAKQNADNARQANQLAASARSQAEGGGEVVSKAVAAMADISHSSKKIADITSVIDGIAFQTNLLALPRRMTSVRTSPRAGAFPIQTAPVLVRVPTANGVAPGVAQDVENC